MYHRAISVQSVHFDLMCCRVSFYYDKLFTTTLLWWDCFCSRTFPLQIFPLHSLGASSVGVVLVTTFSSAFFLNDRILFDFLLVLGGPFVAKYLSVAQLSQRFPFFRSKLHLFYPDSLCNIHFFWAVLAATIWLDMVCFTNNCSVGLLRAFYFVYLGRLMYHYSWTSEIEIAIFPSLETWLSFLLPPLTAGYVFSVFLHTGVISGLSVIPIWSKSISREALETSNNARRQNHNPGEHRLEACWHGRLCETFYGLRCATYDAVCHSLCRRMDITSRVDIIRHFGTLLPRNTSTKSPN